MMVKHTMMTTETTLTVFFEAPFWVGVWEKNCNGNCMVAKVTFGKEPKAEEILTFILTKENRLNFSHGFYMQANRPAPNPKRRQREAQRICKQNGVSTKSQQALQEQYQTRKQLVKQQKKQAEEANKALRFLAKQQKKKEKHKGH